MFTKTDYAYAICLSMKYSSTPATVNYIAALSLVTSVILAEEIEYQLPFHVIVRTMTDVIGEDFAKQRSLSNLNIN